MSLIKLPSKTYLVGEYASLVGGAAILLATRPQFEIWLASQTTSNLSLPPFKTFRQELISQIQTAISLEDFYFFDPHMGRGGFGASAAVFLGALVQKVGLTTRDPNIWRVKVLELQSALGWKVGSGYDVLAMISGGVCVVQEGLNESAKPFTHLASLNVKTTSWPFADLDWMILRGPRKLATHENIGDVEKRALTLSKISHDVVNAFTAHEEEAFIESMKEFSHKLTELSLVDPHVEAKLNEIRTLPGVLVAKGCGALGVDNQIIIFSKTYSETVSILSKHYEVFDQVLSDGVSVADHKARECFQ